MKLYNTILRSWNGTSWIHTEFDVNARDFNQALEIIEYRVKTLHGIPNGFPIEILKIELVENES